VIDIERIKKKVIEENEGLYDDGIWFYINSCTTWNDEDEKAEVQKDIKSIIHKTIEDSIKYTIEESTIKTEG